MLSDFLNGMAELTTVNFFTPVKAELARVEARMRAQANGHHPELNTALDQLISSGGKRIRPTVSLLVGSMFGLEPQKRITVAAAVEMLHTATLVHDDLIDGSLLRRGIPTLNAQWSPAATILTGDFIFASAAQLAAETESVSVMKLFSHTLSVIVNGEISQIFGPHGSVNRQAYYERIYAKTASMFELAAVAPAILASCDQETLEAAKSFGYSVGMAFQIVDDILDFASEQEQIGKPVANDLRQGLITLPTLYYFENHADDGHLREALQGDGLNDAAVDELMRAVEDSGAVEESMAEAEQFIEQAMDALDLLPDGEEHQALEELADYAVKRRT